MHTIISSDHVFSCSGCNYPYNWLISGLCKWDHSIILCMHWVQLGVYVCESQEIGVNYKLQRKSLRNLLYKLRNMSLKIFLLYRRRPRNSIHSVIRSLIGSCCMIVISKDVHCNVLRTLTLQWHRCALYLDSWCCSITTTFCFVDACYSLSPSHLIAISFLCLQVISSQNLNHTHVYLTLSILFWFICHDYTEIFETVKSNF